MKYFKLPDLGEGLVEAEIVSWQVKPGARLAKGDIMLTVETAKAMVEIPSPQAGEIVAIFGEPRQIVHTGEVLVEYKADTGGVPSDSGTVVGNLGAGSGEEELRDDRFTVGAVLQEDGQELSRGKTLQGVRRAMAKNISAAHAQVAQVTIIEDADIHLWPKGSDTTVRLIQAIGASLKAEPILNSWYHAHAMRLETLLHIDLGIAVDTPEGLFVPILRGVEKRSAEDLRRGLNHLIRAVLTRKIPAGEMKNPTITLSNFGTIAGKYGNPVIVPPTVCIVGAGKVRDAVVAFQGRPDIHPILPLSISFDHRVITGGEAARFVRALVAELEKSR